MDFEGKQQSLLTFRVGPVLCCAPSLPVRSIITPPKLTHPPGSDSSQPGIFKHGSHIVKVLDLRQKFGIDETKQTQPGNLIITIFENENFAFWVDQILDVFDFPSEGWGNLPAAIPRGVFTRTLLLNKKINLYSEFEKLATIQDLGYLKHYIQQLNAKNETKIEPKKSNTLSTNNSINKTLKTSTTISQPTSAEPKTKTLSDVPATQTTTSNIQNSKINSLPKTETNNNTAAKKITNLKPPVKREETIKTPPLKTTKSTKTKPKTIEKNKYVAPMSTTKTNPQVNKETSHSSAINPVSKTKTKQIYTHQQTKKVEHGHDESSSTGIIIFFLFIFAVLGSVFYYLFPEEFSSNTKYEKQISTNDAEFILQPLPQEPDNSNNLIIDNKENITNNTLMSETPINENIEHKIEIEKEQDQLLSTEENNIIDLENTVLSNVDKTKNQDDLYRAEISKQNNEITITIHQPIAKIENIAELESIPEEEAIKEENISKQNITEQKIKVEIENITITETMPVEPLKQEELNQPIIKEKVIKEVIHTVVKGDTLWAIAKKYVNNPFLYPELARLSNIKNPHRIYPGNRVRIRFIKN